MRIISPQLGLLPIHPGPGGERGGMQEEELQPRQRDMEVKFWSLLIFWSHFGLILVTSFKLIQYLKFKV